MNFSCAKFLSTSFVSLIVACSNTPPRDLSAESLPRNVGLLITESDQISAMIESIAPTAHTRVQNFGTAYDSDLRLRVLKDPFDQRSRYFVLGARTGRITEVDSHGAILPKHDFSVFDDGIAPSSADPLDVAIARDGSLWVTRYLQNSLMILDSNGHMKRTIDLSEFAPANSALVGMSAIAITTMPSGINAGRETAYVALRRLGPPTDDGMYPAATNPSMIIAIDVETYTTMHFVDDLIVRNPWEQFHLRRNSTSELWVTCIGGPLSKPLVEGGLVRIDLTASDPHDRVQVKLDAKAANGFVVSFEIVNENLGYAIVAATTSSNNPTSVIRFNPTSGEVTDTYLRTPQYTLWSLSTLDEDTLLVTNRSKEAPGLVLLSRRNGARVGFVPTKLPPVEFSILRANN